MDLRGDTGELGVEILDAWGVCLRKRPTNQHDVVRPLDADAARLVVHNKARQRAAHRERDDECQRGKLAHLELGAQKNRLVHATTGALPCTALSPIAASLTICPDGKPFRFAILDRTFNHLVGGVHRFEHLQAKHCTASFPASSSSRIMPENDGLRSLLAYNGSHGKSQ